VSAGKAAVNAPQSKRSATAGVVELRDRVWTAVALAPLWNGWHNQEEKARLKK
jgi:hypothetical protein